MRLKKKSFKVPPFHFTFSIHSFRIRKSLGIFWCINASTPAWNAFLEGTLLPPSLPYTHTRTSAAGPSSIRFLDSQLSTSTNYISTLKLGKFRITTFTISLTRAFLKENIFLIHKNREKKLTDFPFIGLGTVGSISKLFQCFIYVV